MSDQPMTPPANKEETETPRILIAEDDPTSRLILEDMLAEWNYPVIAVEDGKQALDILTSPNPPQLAILDWLMPEMDGPDVCRILRRAHGSTPQYLILLTSKRAKADIVAGLQAGADDYITKPFDANELLARLRVGERFLRLQSELANRIDELEDALSHVRRLQGILPICSYCNRIRDDQDYWRDVTSYLSEFSDAMLSHGICPQCLQEHFPEVAKKHQELLTPKPPLADE